jgi:hypothetical protein
MGRGLSPLQKDILSVLPKFTVDTPEAEIEESGLGTSEVVQALGLDETEVNRVSVSRALSRLKKRKMVNSRFVHFGRSASKRYWNGSRKWSGGVYFIPDENLQAQIEAEREAFRIKWENR